MAHLTDTLEKFARRDLTLSDLKRICLEIAQGDGPLSAEIRHELATARDAGTLRPSEYEMLEFSLAGAVLAGPAAAKASRAVLTEGDDGDEDATVIRPTVGGSDPIDSDIGNEDSTVIRPLPRTTDDHSEDETVISRPMDPRGDADETTVIAGSLHDDEAPTVVRPRTHSAPNAHDDDAEEATVFLNASNDADGTVVAGPGTGDNDETVAVDRTSMEDDTTVVISSNRSSDDDKTLVAGSEELDDGDKTRVTGASANAQEQGDDATTLNPAVDQDATTVNRPLNDDDATAFNATASQTSTFGDDEFDVFNGAMDEPSDEDITGGESTWDPTSAGGAKKIVDRTFTKGSVLKDRFRLIDALGEGGMGTVWRAVDILKIEAQDRNPYVAIKLLQGDFKAHPEAFIALQRESSKQQRLAHPNIATVFDFDREAESGTVFMTMEVMNGQDLADFVKTIPEGGMDYEEAMDLIEQLGSGLSYAHNAGLVHSDLKPGNCFLTDENRLKLLDFGIARASATRDDAEGEETKFDPGQLGALTPSYATVEMFAGQEPDPRDDIYAMAIIAHQLFTGKHPFNRRPAPKAMNEEMTVEPLDKLTTRQNKALAQGLAFLRDDRTASVEEFLEGLRPRKTNFALTVGMPLALAAALVVGFWAPVTDYLDEQERIEILGELKAGEHASITAVLDAASALDDEDQVALIKADESVVQAIVTLIAKGGDANIADGLKLAERLAEVDREKVKNHPDAVSTVVSHYQARMDGVFDPATGKYDVATANQELEQLRVIYANRAEAFQVRDSFFQRRSNEVSAQALRLETLLQEGKLLPDDGADDVGDVLAVLRQLRAIEPTGEIDEVINSPTIAARFAQVARESIDGQDYAGAERLLGVGLRYAPQDAELANLSRDVLAELKRIRNAKRAGDIEAALGPKRSEFTNLADFESSRAELLELAQLKPSSELLGELRRQFEAIFETEFSALNAADSSAEAQNLLVRSAALLEFARLRGHAATLEAVRPTDTTISEADTRVKMAKGLLANPEHSASWNSTLEMAFKELLALMPSTDARVIEVRDAAVAEYAAHARTSGARDDYDSAFASLAIAREFYPQWQDYASLSADLTQRQDAYLAAKAEAERLARLEALKATLLEQAQSDQPDAAIEALRELRAGLPPEDEFVAEQAPNAIAQSYWRLSAARASSGDYETAVRLVDSGLELVPEMLELSSARAEYVSELRGRAVDAQVNAPQSAPMLPIIGSLPTSVDTRLDAVKPSIQTGGLGGTQIQPKANVALPEADPSNGFSPLPRSPGVVFETSAPALSGAMGQRVAEALLSQLDLRLEAIAELAQPVETFARLYPDSADTFTAALADVVAQKLRAFAAESKGDAEALAQPLEAFASLFPKQHDTVFTAIGETAASEILSLARAEQVDLTQLSKSLDGYAQVFSNDAQSVREGAIAQLRNSFISRAEAANGDARLLANALRDLESFFGPDAAPIRSATASVLSSTLVAAVSAANGQITQFAALVAAYTELLPEQGDALSNPLGQAVADALTDRVRATPEDVTELGTVIGQVRNVSPAAFKVAVDAVSTAAVEALVTLARSQEPAAFAASAGQVVGDWLPATANVDGRLGPVVSDRLTDIAKVGDMAALADAARQYDRVLPQSMSVIRQAVLPVAVDSLAAQAGEDDASVAGFGAPVEALNRGFPQAGDEINRRLAPVLIDTLVRTVRGGGLSFDGLDASVRTFRTLAPSQVANMERRVTDAVNEVLAEAAREQSLDSVAMATRTALGILPGATQAVVGRLGPLLTDRLVEIARQGDIDALAEPTQTFGRLLPDAVQNMQSRLVPAAVDALVTRAGRADTELSALRTPVETLRRVFPESGEQLERKLAPEMVGRLVRLASAAGTDVSQLNEPVRMYRNLFSAQSEEMERRVAEALVDALTGSAASQPNNIAALAGPLRDFRALVPRHAKSIDEPLGNVLANGLRGRVSGSSEGLAALEAPVSEFRRMLPERVSDLDRIVGSSAIDAIESAVRAERGQLDGARARLDAFGRVFPARLDDARQRIAQIVADAVLALARNDGENIKTAIELVGQFSDSFPDQGGQIRQDVAQVLWRSIEREAEQRPGQLGPIADRLRDYQSAFPQDYDALSGTLVSRTARDIQRNARNTKVSLIEVASQLGQFRELFPSQHAAVATDVGGALTERLSGADVSTAKQVAALGPALREVQSLFPDKIAVLRTSLGDKTEKQVQALIATDPFKANDLHIEARKVFPQHEGLAAISIELPLPEVAEGIVAVNEGMLKKARALLDRALAKNATHSTIPAFQKSLESRERKGLAAYAEYKKVVKTSRRASDHARALKLARTLWRDNETFKDIRPPAPYACIGNKAGLGQRVPCYDKVGKRRSSIGPVMVVIPVGGGLDRPYAISKYEVSVSDWNRYCYASKACEPRKAKRSLPVSGVSVGDIDKYTKWLSTIAKANYRLPTSQEWEHAAKAGGKQPKKDFNCTVVVGNQQLKGLSVTSAKSGLDNGWGLVNYVGNLREIVREGGGVSARGGSYKNRLQECAIGLKEDFGGSGDDITGFRVVRDVTE